MSTKDDVKEDLAAGYPRLARPDVERVVTLLAQAPATDSGKSIATALKPLVPEVSQRLDSLSADDVTEYLRVLQGAGTMVLQSWKEPDAAGPGIGQIHSFIDTLES
ncbi:MAG: hypothetical protein U1D00_15910 [Mycobacterium sp.]|nr:hypothetical protein [Mycobacterium sp.]